MSNQKFRALIIDDSPTDQQTLSHLLTKRLNCQIETANDGLEGIDKLSRQRFSVVFLDMLMPLMNGDEVLKEIRGYPATADLPVVICSSQADPKLVKSVVKLGIFDYVLKPYNKEGVTRLVATFERLKAHAEESTSDDAPAENGRPVLLVADADNNFRHFVATTLSEKFNVIQAGSGALAVSLVLKQRPQVLLAGPELGILGRDKLIQKLRASKATDGLKIFAVDGDNKQKGGFDSKLFEGTVPRTYIPEVFLKAIDQILVAPAVRGPKGLSVVEQLKPALVSATEQVFGMMMAVEVSETAEPTTFAPDAQALVGTISLSSYSEEKKLTIIFGCDKACAAVLATKMVGEKKQVDGEEPTQRALAEVMSITGGRIENTLDEQGRTYLLGSPRVEERQGIDISSPGASVTHFVGEGGLRFCIAMSASPCPSLKVAKTDLKEGWVLAQDVPVANAEPVLKGTQLSAETLSQVQSIGPEEIEIFEPV